MSEVHQIDAVKIEVGGTEYEAYVDSVYKTLPSLTVALDPDPLDFGPSRISRKIAMCRTHLDRVEIIFKQLSELLHYAQKRLRKAQAYYELSVMDLIANDPETRTGRSQREREALATMKLLDEYKAVKQYEGAVEDIASVIVVVKSTRADLRDTRGRIKDQMQLIDAERSLGASWKRKDGSAESLQGGVGSDAVVSLAGDGINIDDLLEQASPSLAFSPMHDQDPEPPPEPDPEPEPEPETPLTSLPKTGTKCSVCGGVQYEAPGGPVCKNGHGGAPPLDDDTDVVVDETRIEDVKTASMSDLLPGDNEEEVDAFLNSDIDMDETPNHVADQGDLDEILAMFD